MTWRRGEAGSTLIDRPKDAPVPDFHECQGKGYTVSTLRFHRLVQNVVTGLAYKILELDLGWCVTEPRLGQWD